jgi:hypothetical protein
MKIEGLELDLIIDLVKSMAVVICSSSSSAPSRSGARCPA